MPPAYASPVAASAAIVESPSYLDAEERETIGVFQRNTPSVVNITSLQAVQVQIFELACLNFLPHMNIPNLTRLLKGVHSSHRRQIVTLWMWRMFQRG